VRGKVATGIAGHVEAGVELLGERPFFAAAAELA
jgi:hypothetical protein